ncbi:MAG: VOC family protein [Novosphingobium sp.]
MKRALSLIALLLAQSAQAQTTPPPPTDEGAAVNVLGPVLNVGSRERSVDFYTKGLGMVVTMDMGSDKRHETMLGFPGDRSKPGIILLIDLTAKAPRTFTQGTAFERLVLRVRNISGVVARLRALGHKVSDVRDVAQGYRMAMATDPDGYKLELVESGRPAEKP